MSDLLNDLTLVGTDVILLWGVLTDFRAQRKDKWPRLEQIISQLEEMMPAATDTDD